jgi:hypothetical protein
MKEAPPLRLRDAHRVCDIEVAELGRWLKSVVQGYFNYNVVPGKPVFGVFGLKYASAGCG